MHQSIFKPQISPKPSPQYFSKINHNLSSNLVLDYATTTAPYYTLEFQEDGSKNYVCTSCSRKYKSLPSVVQHYRHVHLRLRPKLRSCFLCEVKVPGHARAFHLEKEHGIPAPTCNACGKKFAYPFQVLRHQKNDHMGEKKFGCSECELRFTSQANLTQHMIKHSSVRVHKCEICEKSFKWKKNLRTHIMMHMDERRHVCPVCKDAFVQQSSLSYHITKRHPEYV